MNADVRPPEKLTKSFGLLGTASVFVVMVSSLIVRLLRALRG
jgi:hypothetical protein